MAKKWIALDGDPDASLSVTPDETDDDGNVLRYRVWPADQPEPPGNPFKFTPEALRVAYKPEDEGK